MTRHSLAKQLLLSVFFLQTTVTFPAAIERKIAAELQFCDHNSEREAATRVLIKKYPKDIMRKVINNYFPLRFSDVCSLSAPELITSNDALKLDFSTVPFGLNKKGIADLQQELIAQKVLTEHQKISAAETIASITVVIAQKSDGMYSILLLRRDEKGILLVHHWHDVQTEISDRLKCLQFRSSLEFVDVYYDDKEQSCILTLVFIEESSTTFISLTLDPITYKQKKTAPKITTIPSNDLVGRQRVFYLPQKKNNKIYIFQQDPKANFSSIVEITVPHHTIREYKTDLPPFAWPIKGAAWGKDIKHILFLDQQGLLWDVPLYDNEKSHLMAIINRSKLGIVPFMLVNSGKIIIGSYQNPQNACVMQITNKGNSERKKLLSSIEKIIKNDLSAHTLRENFITCLEPAEIMVYKEYLSFYHHRYLPKQSQKPTIAKIMFTGISAGMLGYVLYKIGRKIFKALEPIPKLA